MDGSARGAARPARLRGPRRAFPPPAACIQNRSDGTGKRKAATARPIAYIDVIYPPLRSAFFNYLPQRPLDIRKGRAQSRPPGIDHDVPLRADFRAVQPERFPDATLDPIADHRSADRPRHGETQPGRVSRRVRDCQAESREQGTGESDTVIIDGSEFGSAQNPRSLRKLERAAGGGFSCWP